MSDLKGKVAVVTGASKGMFFARRRARGVSTGTEPDAPVDKKRVGLNRLPAMGIDSRRPE